MVIVTPKLVQEVQVKKPGRKSPIPEKRDARPVKEAPEPKGRGRKSAAEIEKLATCAKTS